MAMISMHRLLEHARSNRYAVGYFESWNLESILSVVNAAERTHSPVIIGFGGLFLGNCERKVVENIQHYGALGRAIAEQARVPVALLLNEADQLPMLVQGLKAGFNAIMHQDPACSFEETIEINQYLVKTAHYLGADVEAEVGELPNADIALNTQNGGTLTDPDKAAFFVAHTGVDALAVAIGNVHLLENGKASLDFELIRRILKKVSLPLVLHGGTGIAEADLKEAIALGMCKVNVGTSLKRTFLAFIDQYAKQYDLLGTDPHEIIGKGGASDMLTGAREAMTEEVIRYMKIFGSENRATDL
jgi:ketose-bisphosphate aldolase